MAIEVMAIEVLNIVVSTFLGQQFCGFYILQMYSCTIGLANLKALRDDKPLIGYVVLFSVGKDPHFPPELK